MTVRAADARRALLVTGMAALLVATTPAHAQQPAGPQEAQASRWVPFPGTRLFPTAIADPMAAVVGLSALGVTDLGIENAGDTRVMLQVGGQFGVVRWRPRGDAGWALQASIDGGFNGQFDASSKTDNIGWDGIYGVTISAASPRGLALKFGTMHVSSHIGDEFIEKTGRQRINYTRQELVVGVSWPAARALRLYGEVGGAVHLLNDELQQPWRVQAGAEILKPGWPWRSRGGWYAAVDAASWEERDWAIDLSAQLGLFYPAGDRRWRTGIGVHRGRVPIGEFFQDSETYWSLGFYIDL